MASRLYLYASCAEFLIICTTLCLFSYGYPDFIRLSLWEEGGARHFNSDPRLRIYFYANHQEPPAIPYIWSQTFTDFNLSVGILAFWVCLIKLILVWFEVRSRQTELFLQGCALVSWVLCFASQLSRDLSDEEHQSRVPWYLCHSCGVAQPPNKFACHLAQATFSFTILSMCLATATALLTLVEPDDDLQAFYVKQRRVSGSSHKDVYDDVFDSGEDDHDDNLEM